MGEIEIPPREIDLRATIENLQSILYGVFDHPESFGSVDFLSQGLCADSSTNFLVHNRSGQPVAVALLSPESVPDLIESAIAKSQYLKEKLGHELGVVIPTPLAQGTLFGNSYAVMPYFYKLSDSRLKATYENYRVRTSLYDWLLSATTKTLTKPSGEEIEAYFRHPLQHLKSLGYMSAAIKDVADRALKRLDQGKWSPRFCTMHGDLWRGNILIDHQHFTGREEQTWPNQFVIIDWAGALEKGYGLFDLVRISESLHTLPTTLRRQLMETCEVLNCTVSDASSYIAAALGYLGLNLGHFPKDRYREMSSRCMRTLESSL